MVIRLFKHGLHWGSRLLLALLLLPILLLAFLILLDTDEYQAVLIDEFSRQFGMRLEMDQQVEWSWSGQPRLVFRDIQIYAQPDDEIPLLQADTLAASIALQSLWQGETRFENIELSSSQIDIAQWSQTGKQTFNFSNLAVDEISLQDLQVKNLPPGWTYSSLQFDSARWRRSNSQAMNLAVDLRLGEQNIHLAGRLGDYHQGALNDIALQAVIEDNIRINIQGNIKKLAELSGFDLNLDVFIRGDGHAANENPLSGLGLFQEVLIRGHLSGALASWHLDTTKIRANNSNLRLEATGELKGEKMEIRPDLEIYAVLKDIAQLKQLHLPRPFSGPLELRARLEKPGESFVLSGVRADLKNEEMELQATGKITANHKGYWPALDLVASGSTLSSLLPPTSWSRWVDFPFTASARLQRSGDDLKLANLEVIMDQQAVTITGRGELNQLLTQPGVLLQLELEGPYDKQWQLLPDFVAAVLDVQDLHLLGKARAGLRQ